MELPPPRIHIPRERYIVDTERASPTLLYETLVAPPVDVIERPYTLDEIRYSVSLRDRMPRIDLNTVTFESGSWELGADQIPLLADIGAGIRHAIEQNARGMFSLLKGTPMQLVPTFTICHCRIGVPKRSLSFSGRSLVCPRRTSAPRATASSI